jgi:TPR repeat protein
MAAEWATGLCYYYGRGVPRDAAQAKVWFRRAAAQGHPGAVQVVQSGEPGYQGVREVLARFTNAGSAPPRHEAAHEFAGMVNEKILGPFLQACSRKLHEGDSAVPHQSVRDGI